MCAVGWNTSERNRKWGRAAMSETVDFRRCTGCECVFGRSRWMVRRGTVLCRKCAQKRARMPLGHMRAIGVLGNEARRKKLLAGLTTRLAGLTNVECYQLGRQHEYHRLWMKYLSARVAS